jgi:sigma-B regulation protein RsbU (phosphoserine phosphatase)
VGGDLYYYRQRQGNSILFAIGDVSDKGVPAALFMARAMAVLEAAATQELTPAEIVTSVNVALTEDNDLCMFVTLLVGELDLSTGHCTLSSAGHEQPIRVSPSSAGILAIPTGPPVGLDAETEFFQTTIVLEPQECLLAYTDGITEARNPRGSMFGDERLLKTLNTDGGGSPAGVLKHTLTDVDQFVDGADQADDITLLAIQWQPKGNPVDAPARDAVKETTPATGATDDEGAMDYAVKAGCHHGVLASVQSALGDLRLQAGDPGDLDLIIEETLTNVVKYAGCAEDAEGRVEWAIAGSRLTLTFIDPGKPFDPLADKEPEAGADEFSEGGMGVMLIRHMAESTHYHRQQGSHRFTVVLPLTPRLSGD